jgi:hypothetical protein
MSITFSSSFYIIKSKFAKEKYIEWMNNLISIVNNNFYLVIYTDKNSVDFINTRENPNIKVIIKEMENFYNYKYKDYWIKNHRKNIYFNDESPYNTNWELNMLWSEKVWFVNETVNNRYYDTEFYGWCDIGYFRNSNGDVNTSELLNWPNKSTIEMLNKTKIHYACIQNSDVYLGYLKTLINDRNLLDLPKVALPSNQYSVAGGFFIIHKTKVDWWAICYDQKLNTYLEHDYLVKDDQIILIDCIFSNENDFALYREKDERYNNWFMFQRILY